MRETEEKSWEKGKEKNKVQIFMCVLWEKKINSYNKKTEMLFWYFHIFHKEQQEKN